MTGGRRRRRRRRANLVTTRFLNPPSPPPADDRGDEEKGEKEVEAFFLASLAQLRREGGKGCDACLRPARFGGGQVSWRISLEGSRN